MPTGTWTILPVRRSLVAVLDLVGRAEERHADVVLLEVEHHADDVVRELEELTGHGVFKAVHARNAVADRQTVPVSRTSTFLS
jgi:hypothetical protein